MPEPTKKTTKRSTKREPVRDTRTKPVTISSDPQAFQLDLNAKPAETPQPADEKHVSPPIVGSTYTPIKPSASIIPNSLQGTKEESTKPFSTPALNTSTSKEAEKKKKNRIWHLLEWLTTSLLIFVIFFFAINFSSYSELLRLKIDQIRGDFKVNPFIEKILNGGNGTVQDLHQELPPLSQNSEETKRQIPPLNMEVTPPDFRIIIPRINKNVPVVPVNTENLIKRDWGALEKDIQEALREGVVHYPGTAEPGQNGNVVITGHSSYFPWDAGRFKDVFALLHEVNIGDQIIVFDNQKKFLYEVYDKQVILPNQVDVLTQEGDDRLTLITCTPVGTNLKRLIILAKPVSLE